MTATLAVSAGLVMIALLSAYIYRLAKGPSIFDRLLGLSGFGTNTTLVLLLVGAGYERLDMFVDLSLAYALLSFVGAIAAARYFERGGQHR